MKTTRMIKKQEITIGWHKIDADGKILGKVATEITHLLIGKHKPSYVPYLNSGDKVVVLNSKKVALSGTKELNKIYYTHSQHIGNLKSLTAQQVRESNPNRIILHAVKGMLPKNRLRDVRLANLYIYDGAEHPHQAQLNDK